MQREQSGLVQNTFWPGSPRRQARAVPCHSNCSLPGYFPFVENFPFASSTSLQKTRTVGEVVHQRILGLVYPPICPVVIPNALGWYNPVYHPYLRSLRFGGMCPRGGELVVHCTSPKLGSPASATTIELRNPPAQYVVWSWGTGRRKGP